MKWYNVIFSKIGNRRLMTQQEFWAQVKVEAKVRSIRVVEGRQHELLLRIAALADIATRHAKNNNDLQNGLTAAKELRTAIMTYKIVEDNANTPPSTNAHEELILADFPS